MPPKGDSMASIASSGGKVEGVPTGVAHWYQLLDNESNRFYFYEMKKKTTAWGLPLRDSVPENEIVPHGRIGTDDWCMSIDPQSGKKFYQSVKYSKVQWTIPLLYRARLGKLPYFQQKRVSLVGSKAVAGVTRPALKKQMSLPTLISKIGIEEVLEDSTTCAAFHRFLVATHAEENLLFWGAAEVYRKGQWKGMKVIGVESEETANGDNEGESMLQSQLATTRASVRIGIAKRVSAGREARVIYDKFLKPGAPMEVCVKRSIADKVESVITSGKSIEDRSIFENAQEEVLRNLEEDTLPRFLATALSEKEETVGTKDLTFKSDEVVRTALKRIATPTAL